MRREWLPRVAYFCMEFGLHESFPIYAGGLGVLAGDLMKAACDAKVPLVGFGLLWSEGYTDQRIGADGRPYDQPNPVPRHFLEPVEPRISLKIRGKDVEIRAWKTNRFGSADLYLLEPVHEEDRWITRRLYQGGKADRIAQELLLGVGGVRMLRALGLYVDVYHFNEGHASFAGLELMREQMALGLNLDAARHAVRDKIVFTTHTPVPAGNEEHPIHMMNEQGVDLGVFHSDQLARVAGDPFGMTPCGLRLARVANGVARLHAETARKMWSHVHDAAPILSITNGVHRGTWQAGEIVDALFRGGDLWTAHQQQKSALLELIQERTGAELRSDRLLIGFARRAATYKRATMLFEDLVEIEPLLIEGKVQAVFAGKAHPADHGGKDLIAKLVEMTKKYPNRVVFLESYDIGLGAAMTRGCDVWLNNPRRPMEASGTSGMKAAMNGCLNLSTLDGWWAEGCSHGVNGWQFGDAKEGEGADEHDRRALYHVLKQGVLPTYYEHRERWVQMMTDSILMSQERFSAQRMLEDYYELMYRKPAQLDV